MALTATFLSRTPAALFTMVVINPSGPTIAGAVAVVAALMYMRRTETRSDGLLAIGASALALSRSDGWFWLVIVVALCALLLRWTPAALWAAVGVGARIVVVGVVVVSASWSLLVRPQLVKVPTDLTGWTLVSAVLRRTTTHVDEAIGLFGWFDTTIPALASYLWWAALGALAMVAYLDRCRRGLLVALTAFVGFIAVGWLGDWIPAHRIGLVWQGRYSIPLLIVGVTALGYRFREESVHPSAAPVVGLCATIVWNAGYYQALRRWSVGAHGALSPLNWEKGGSAVHPLVCLVLFAVASCALWWLNFGRPALIDDQTPAPAWPDNPG